MEDGSLGVRAINDDTRTLLWMVGKDAELGPPGNVTDSDYDTVREGYYYY